MEEPAGWYLGPSLELPAVHKYSGADPSVQYASLTGGPVHRTKGIKLVALRWRHGSGPVVAYNIAAVPHKYLQNHHPELGRAAQSVAVHPGPPFRFNFGQLLLQQKEVVRGLAKVSSWLLLFT